MPYVGRIVATRAAQRAAVGAGSLYGINLISDQAAHAYRNARAAYREASRLTNLARHMVTPTRLFATPSRGRIRSTPMSRGRVRSRMRRYRARARSTPKRVYRARRYARPSTMRGIVRRVMPSRVYKPTGSVYNYANRLLGPLPGTGTRNKKKEYMDTEWETTLLTKKLYSAPIIRVPWNDVDDTMNHRLTGAVDVTGIKVTTTFRYTASVDGEPLAVRWALLINKETKTATNVDIPETDFFKKVEEVSLTGDSGDPFSQFQSAMGYNRSQINPKLYYILRQGRFLLTRNNAQGTGVKTGGGTKQMEQYGSINEYIPLNTQVRFPGNGGFEANEYPVDNNVYIVFWVYPVGTTPIDGETAGQFEVYNRFMTYFRDSANF